MKIELELSDKRLKELEEFIKDIQKPFVFHVLSEKDFTLITDIFEPIFEKIYDRKLYDKYLKPPELDCETCLHNVSFHSQVGTRICCKEGCHCMEYKSKEDKNVGNESKPTEDPGRESPEIKHE